MLVRSSLPKELIRVFWFGLNVSEKVLLLTSTNFFQLKKLKTKIKNNFNELN